jgi:hypothetical protein
VGLLMAARSRGEVGGDSHRARRRRCPSLRSRGGRHGRTDRTTTAVRPTAAAIRRRVVRRCDSACGRVTRSSRPLEQEPRRRPRGSRASRIAFSPPGLGRPKAPLRRASRVAGRGMPPARAAKPMEPVCRVSDAQIGVLSSASIAVTGTPNPSFFAPPSYLPLW